MVQRMHPRLALSLLALLLAGAASPAAGTPAAGDPVAGTPAVAGGGFADVTEHAGLNQPHHPRQFDNQYAALLQGYATFGAAAAVGDFDGDGLEDLFLTDAAESAPNHLYRNRGDFTFSDLAAAAGVAGGNDADNASTDALWFDADDDGDADLFLARMGRSLLYLNQGDGTFRENAAAGFGGRLNTVAVLSFDYDGDGRLDLLLGNYSPPVNVFQPESPRFFPESFENADNGGGVTLYRNQGAGSFAERTSAAGLELSGWTLDLGHADADRDGDQDLYLACDFGTDRFFRNQGGGRFSDRTGAAIGTDTKKGMNADWGDYDGDGWLDVYVTNITEDYMREGNFLWRNNRDGTFTDVARETGSHDTGWGWAGKFLDADNDGWLDLYVANGQVSAGPEDYALDVFAMLARPGVDLADARNWPPIGGKSLSGYQTNKFFRNLEGIGFREEAARQGLDSRRDGRGIAVADFDHDGAQDLLLTNSSAAPQLYRNTRAGGGQWLALALEGRGPNRDAVGAEVALVTGGRTLVRFVDGGNGFAAASSKRLHFGLAAATAAERLEVRWPSGRRQTFRDLAAGRWYRLAESGDASAPAGARP